MTRETLAPRRLCETFAFQHSGHSYTASVGRFPDAALAKIEAHT